MIGTIQMNLDETITNIINNFYSNHNSFSDVTSSHWSKYDNNVFETKNNIIELKNAGGFGDFTSNTFKNILNHSAELLLTEYLLYKQGVDKQLIQMSRMICGKQKKLQMFDSVKHLIILNNLKKNFELDKYSSFCIIGDGFGYLTSVLRALYPEKKIFNVNLGRQLLYDYILLRQAFPEEKIILLNDASVQDAVSATTIFIPAEKYHLIGSLNIEFFFNIASMQEMDLAVINNYFKYMRNSQAKEKVFYCCNRDFKTLPDASIIHFNDYGWGEGKIIFDSVPEWYLRYPNPRPPFWRPFDGQIRERLFQF